MKQELHELIDAPSTEGAEAVLDYLNMRLHPDELTAEDGQRLFRHA